MRRSASPDDDTMSYCPPPPFAMSATISSEVLAYFALIMQPVCFSNGLTHSGCRYPAQAIRFRWPSPLPIVFSTGRFAVGTAPLGLPPLPPVLLLPPLLLHAASSAAAPMSAMPATARP